MRRAEGSPSKIRPTGNPERVVALAAEQSAKFALSNLPLTSDDQASLPAAQDPRHVSLPARLPARRLSAGYSSRPAA